MPGSVEARVSAPATPAADSPRRATASAALRSFSLSIASASQVSRRAMAFIHRAVCPLASWAHCCPSHTSHRRQAGTYRSRSP